jgi:hypothetical protein
MSLGHHVAARTSGAAGPVKHDALLVDTKASLRWRPRRTAIRRATSAQADVSSRRRRGDRVLAVLLPHATSNQSAAAKQSPAWSAIARDTRRHTVTSRHSTFVVGTRTRNAAPQRTSKTHGGRTVSDKVSPERCECKVASVIRHIWLLSIIRAASQSRRREDVASTGERAERRQALNGVFVLLGSSAAQVASGTKKVVHHDTCQRWRGRRAPSSRIGVV